MIIHKLIRHHLKHGDDDAFYVMQAEEALRWMVGHGVTMGPGLRVLDLGCGHGTFGYQFVKRGCPVTFSDCKESLRPELRGQSFRVFAVGERDLSELGQYDLVLFSNVFEHLPDPDGFLREIPKVVAPGGLLYLSWTNWLSPWGGHDFSPFHYLGPHLGPKVFDWLKPGKRQHRPFDGLYPTYIGETLRKIRARSDFEVLAIAPRYYTEFAFLMRLPILREFLAWNCALLIRRRA